MMTLPSISRISLQMFGFTMILELLFQMVFYLMEKSKMIIIEINLENNVVVLF